MMGGAPHSYRETECASGDTGCCCLQSCRSALLPIPPLSADSLLCLKNCVSFTLGPVRPSVDQFHKYLPWFLSDPPNIKCPKG